MRGIFVMSKIEDNKRKALKEATELLKDKTQEEANNYIAENLMITQITKAFMAAYIKKYATSDEDKNWIKEDFKKASEKTVTRKVSTVCVDANGDAIYKINKHGQAIPKTIRVNSITGEKYTTFDFRGARKAFIEHFDITPKDNKFKPKAKRTEPIFDEFDGLF